MWYVLTAVVFLFGCGTAAFRRAQVELPQGGLSRPTFVLFFTAFIGSGAAVIGAAVTHAWPLAIPAWVALASGAAGLLLGLVFWLPARVPFTFQRRWGLTLDSLVVHGVYRWTRNPQVLAWILMYTGAGLLGRSAAALAIVAMFTAASIPWIRAEERALEARFGEGYRRYRSSTPRFLGAIRRRTRAAPPNGYL